MRSRDLFEHLASHSVAKDEFVTGFSKYGTSTAEDVYETATQLSWICTAASGQIVPTLLGEQAHAGTGRSGKLRCQLAKIIEATHPAWAALLPKGRTEALVGFPQEIRQCFEEALLLGDATEDVVAWWSRSAGLMRAASQEILVAIGIRGERKTISFEQARTGRTPSWRGFESAYAGYDVLSARANGDAAPLKIEVKASERSFRYAQIHITEHEWITATLAPADYVFHVWLFDEASPRLFVIASSVVAGHTPMNSGKGRWRSTAIPLNALTHPSNAIIVPD